MYQLVATLDMDKVFYTPKFNYYGLSIRCFCACSESRSDYKRQKEKGAGGGKMEERQIISFQT
jgi:hypothetical protein